jgi:hypothetical protein
VLLRIELFAVRLIVVESSVFGSRHSLDIRRPIVAPIEIHMMTMSARDIGINPVAQVPFIGQSVRG